MMPEDKTTASLSTHQPILLQEKTTVKGKRKLQAEVAQGSQQIAFLADYHIYPCTLFQSVAFARYAKLQQPHEIHMFASNAKVSIPPQD